ncbi:serine/threonine-protein phosphatase [Actinospica durhamensis]|uniref:Serine/threonine-protein phosphatase n=1 Tax=Actinospica durhamensis TaxID=1508375 RepID=A0A941ENM5_9ACTN|nr:PP2C family protein-serine/threonine phosphatase [Actinospica durhamensis]MBR7834400.1 serine/threonine-protein phosphatase [Actinospica durhamensis]
MTEPDPTRPPALPTMLTWTIVLTTVLLGMGVAVGNEVRLVGLLAFLPGILAGVGTVRQTVFVASWVFGATLASALYFPDPHSSDAYFLVILTFLLCVAAVYVCHHRTTREREMARLRITATAMQREILAPLPQRTAEVVVDGVYEPMHEDKLVGGDVYDVVASPYGTRVLIGDVQGKGLPAIGTAFGIIGAFREAAYREAELAGVVDALESAVVRHNTFAARSGGGERFATALILHLDADRRTHVEAINCGHLPPILLGRPGGPRFVEFPDNGLPLGLADLVRGPRSASGFELRPGESLLLYTDGLTEARTRRGEFYPTERAVQMAEHLMPDRVPEALRDDLVQFSRGGQADDIAILSVSRNPGRAITAG